MGRIHKAKIKENLFESSIVSSLSFWTGERFIFRNPQNGRRKPRGHRRQNHL